MLHFATTGDKEAAGTCHAVRAVFFNNSGKDTVYGQEPCLGAVSAECMCLCMLFNPGPGPASPSHRCHSYQSPHIFTFMPYMLAGG